MQLWADDDLALAAGLGWAHARDRLVQMVLLRLVGQGRLAECLQSTEETVGIDVWARDMGFARDVVADEELVSDQARRVAEAYAAGVNEVLTRRRRPFELLLVGHRPEPWRLADVLLTIKIMTYVGLAQTQVDFEKLLVQALRGGVPVDALRRLVSPHLDGLDDATVEQLRQLRWVAPLLPPAVRFATAAARASASNNWAVAASRSASGSALLASDPHMEINRLPALWYETVLHTRDDYRIGITMPGVPGLVMGRTSRIAFGFTYGFMDMVDFFVDEVRGSAVRRGERWVPLAARQEEVRRKGAEPVVVTIRENSLGVLEADPLRPELEDGLYLTRAWSAQRAGAAPSLDAIVRMPLARTVAEAQQLLRTITISCNWLVADRDGSIGYQQSGRLPERAHSGLHPVSGADPSTHWRGWVDPARLLAISNPAEGFLATANHELNPPGGPLAVNLPMGSYRHDRICAVLAATERATLDDLKRLQNDVYSLHAERFMALLGPLLPASPAAELLRRWDCRYDLDSRGATVFEDGLPRAARPGLRRRAVRRRGLAGDRRGDHRPDRLLPPLRQRHPRRRPVLVRRCRARGGAPAGPRAVARRHRRRGSPALGLDPAGDADRHLLRRESCRAGSASTEGRSSSPATARRWSRAGSSPPTTGTPPSPHRGGW